MSTDSQAILAPESATKSITYKAVCVSCRVKNKTTMTINTDTGSATTISTAIRPISASRTLVPKLNMPTVLNIRIITLRDAWAFLGH
mgnify:CR=1 FL=1